MTDSRNTEIPCGCVTLRIRNCVARRSCELQNASIFYLSLLEDEIDDRSGRMFSSLVAGSDRSSATAVENLEAVSHQLELTDALVVCQHRGRTSVLRGGSCCFPLYWSGAGGRLQISTALPVPAGAKLSKEGLIAAIAAVSLQGSYEPNAMVETPLAGWNRLRRGAVSTFDGAAFCRERMIVAPPAQQSSAPAEETICAQLQDAFSQYGRSQRRVRSSIVELSGGFDSTLAAAAARAPVDSMRGISVEFPYYEFRFEAQVQKEVGSALGISRATLDGTNLFPFTRWQRPPQFDEPSVFITGIRHAEEVARYAVECGAHRIYVGHGGDQLFSTDLDGQEQLPDELERGPFSPKTWRSLQRATGRLRNPRWRERATGCFVYDARQDVWAKELFAATVRTPFTDLAVFRAAQLWSRWSSSIGARPDKTILAKAMDALLPDAVKQRRGKVAYDGVWMRAYAVNSENIARTIEDASDILEHLGISTEWLLRRARQLAGWEPVSAREILALYAIASWLECWGIRRVRDVRWEEPSGIPAEVERPSGA